MSEEIACDTVWIEKAATEAERRRVLANRKEAA